MIAEGQLIEYACDKFQEGSYEEALEAFVLAYMRGFEQEWILDNIYSCYMEGNEAEFRQAYGRFLGRMSCSYEECILDFIPCREEEYFVFDKKEKTFLGKFSVKELRETMPDPAFQTMEFSAAAWEMDWDFRMYQPVLVEAKNRKIYVICHDLKRAASFYKIPELGEYMDGVLLFSNRNSFREYFHENTAVYLPRVLFGSEGSEKELAAIIEGEHRYRLTPEGRSTDNVLLTIGIPTHDRGNLLLKRLECLMGMSYDAEVEFAISKNGTHYYQEEYKSVERIRDARINYKGYDCELGMSKNWQNVVKISHGRYVLMVSDEDDVVLTALEHYFKLLCSYKSLGYVRAKTRMQYFFINQNSYFKQGKEAFVNGFLRQNYLSGAIYNRKIFMESHIDYWDEHYSESTFYKLYPHMWWQVLMAFQGDYAVDCQILIIEGESVLSEEALRYKKDNVADEDLTEGMVDWECPEVPVPSTYESRLKQFQSGMEMIKDLIEFEELRTIALSMFASKTLYLMALVFREYNYKKESFPYWMDRLREEIMYSMDDLAIGMEGRQCLLTDFLNYTKEIEQWLSSK